MKKVIDGKRYNTETATKVAEYEPFANRTDFNWWCEELYKTKKGKWFIYGEGGANSPYSKRVESNVKSGGEDIIAISDYEALKWLEIHNFVDEIEEYFPDELEDA